MVVPTEARRIAAEASALAEDPDRPWPRRVLEWSRPRRFALVQFPNLPLAIALLAGLTARLTEGTVHRSLRAAFYLALGVWAWEEALRGVNWFRRLLGAGALIYLVVELSSSLHG